MRVSSSSTWRWELGADAEPGAPAVRAPLLRGQGLSGGSSPAGRRRYLRATAVPPHLV